MHGSQNDSASERGFIHRNLGWFYRALWLAPIVGTSLYFNVSDNFFPHDQHADMCDVLA